MPCGSCGGGSRPSPMTTAERQARMISRQSVPVVPSRVKFVAHPPKGSDAEDKIFSTVFEARAWTAGHPGWILEAKRITVQR